MSGPDLLTGPHLRLRPKRLTDAPNDYAWRHDPELSRLDAASPLECTFGEFVVYYGEALYDSDDPWRFAVETLGEDKHIGNIALYNLDRRRKEAEFGIMIGDPAYQDRGYGREATALMLGLAFRNGEFDRVYLKTLEWNGRASRSFAAAGFVPCGKRVTGNYNFLLMEIRREEYERARKQAEESIPTLIPPVD
jgi:RimJ/RimL family protein N-acetyltransferase